MVYMMCAICHEPGPPTVAEHRFPHRGQMLTSYRTICGMCLAPWVPVSSGGAVSVPTPVDNNETHKKTHQTPAEDVVKMRDLRVPKTSDGNLRGAVPNGDPVVPQPFALRAVDVLPFTKKP